MGAAAGPIIGAVIGVGGSAIIGNQQKKAAERQANEERRMKEELIKKGEAIAKRPLASVGEITRLPTYASGTGTLPTTNMGGV